jgi:hypothetical protein
MQRILFIFLMFTLCNLRAQDAANTISLSCSGVVDSAPITFDLIVDTVSGDMWQFPNFIALGCAGDFKDSKVDLSIDANSVQKRCNNGFGYTSTLTLSRISGTLTTGTIVQNQKSGKTTSERETYSCKRITSKLF